MGRKYSIQQSQPLPIPSGLTPLECNIITGLIAQSLVGTSVATANSELGQQWPEASTGLKLESGASATGV